MAHSTLASAQARILGWFHANDAWRDEEVAGDLGVHRATATRWRNGTIDAPLGLLGWALSRLPVLDVAAFLRDLAARYGHRDGLRITITIEDSTEPDPGRMRDDALELAGTAGRVVELAAAGRADTADHARHLARVATRMARSADQLALFPVTLARKAG